MDAICNNPVCAYSKAKKVFQVQALSDQCPSCGLGNLLPKTALKYKTKKESSHHKKVNESKAKIADALNKSSVIKRKSSKNNSPEKNKSKSLKSIEMSYHSKLSKISSSIKNDKVISKFSKIDDDIIAGNASLKELNKELKKIDDLFNDLKNIKEPSLSKAPSKKAKTSKAKIKPKTKPQKAKKLESDQSNQQPMEQTANLSEQNNSVQ